MLITQAFTVKPRLAPHRFRTLSLALAVAATALAYVAPLEADEGMWMPQQVPMLGPELTAKGLELDPNQVADLLGYPLGAIVSLGGCSASFVSPQGLIATNHHCVTASIQYNSTADRNLIAQGFVAPTTAEELATAPGTYVYVTAAIRDVTADITASLAPAKAKGKTPPVALGDAEIARRVERRRRELVDACEKPGGVRCTVGSFFEGEQFLLITQMEIKDVRLVYAPAEGIGNFGGEVDNWTWPRHTGDFSFLRAYVGADGKPAAPAASNVPYKPKHWLKVADKGVKPGDFVWIAGYPGRTYRHKTAGEVMLSRDIAMPTFVRYASAINQLLETENQRGKDVELRNYARVRANANTMKKYNGVLGVMLPNGPTATDTADREAAVKETNQHDPVLNHRRQRENDLLVKMLMSDSGYHPELGEALLEIDRLAAVKAQTAERDAVLDWLERGSPMLAQAIKLHRLSIERPKPDLERADGFRQRDLTRFDQGLARAQRSIEPASDRVGLRYVLERAAALPAGQRLEPVDKAMAATGAADTAAQIEAYLDQLYAKTQVGDLATRQAMSKEPTATLLARGDAMIALAAQLLPIELAREEAGRAYDGAMLRLRPRYLDGLRRAAGGRLYPDANSTLRVTFGKVDGYTPRDGLSFAAQTSLRGIQEKATGKRPFDAPQALLDVSRGMLPSTYLADNLGTVPVNFTATLDITGGNSGSAVLNGRGELVGLAFDGNWEGIAADYLFQPRVARTIAVDVTYMRFVMDLVDDADSLLTEMSLPVVTSGAELEMP